MTAVLYTTQLQAGLGMIEETRTLLDLWQIGMDRSALTHAALESGRFPKMSARRLQNVVGECFAPRFLVPDSRPAELLKGLAKVLAPREWTQLCFLFTCRANAILADFVRDVYWSTYAAGRETISSDDSRAFVVHANQEGKTSKSWAQSTIRRVASYLTGCCGDFGLVEASARSVRRILPFRLESRVAALLAYDLHFGGQGDNQVLGSADWNLFGLERHDVLDELKRLSLKKLMIVQSAGGVTRIGWPCKTVEELTCVLA